MAEKTEHQRELKRAGHEIDLSQNDGLFGIKRIIENEGRKAANYRERQKVIYFNPPWSSSVATKLGKRFLQLVTMKLTNNKTLANYGINLNRRNIKISYSTLGNLHQIIKNSNQKLLNRTTKSDESAKKCLKESQTLKKTCNCRIRADCPLNGNCMQSNVVYKVKVEALPKKKTSQKFKFNRISNYMGSTYNFKERYNSHIRSFKDGYNGNTNTLITHIRKLKAQNIEYKLNWQIIGQTAALNNNGICQLCQLEKYKIMFNNEVNLLNQRNEIMSACRHKQRSNGCIEYWKKLRKKANPKDLND